MDHTIISNTTCIHNELNPTIQNQLLCQDFKRSNYRINRQEMKTIFSAKIILKNSQIMYTHFTYTIVVNHRHNT